MKATKPNAIKQFCVDNGISLRNIRLAERPDCDNSDWSKEAKHYQCVFRMGNNSFVCHFSQGSAHKYEPQAHDVLECLYSDMECAQYGFDDFCSNLGYDRDSRKAERIYEACRESGKKLQKFLGKEKLAALGKAIQKYNNGDYDEEENQQADS